MIFAICIHAGLPLPPTNLIATENGLGSLNISWSFAFQEGIPINFTLFAINLNTTDDVQTTQKTGIRDQYLAFVVDSPTSCDSYSFTVAAVNRVGQGDSSEATIATLPSIPDLSLVEDSLEHSLNKSGDRFLLTVSVMVIPNLS